MIYKRRQRAVTMYKRKKKGGNGNGRNGNGKLTAGQRMFGNEYCKDGNGTRAYKVAYPAVKKDGTAAASASKMLRLNKVAAYIEGRLEKISKKAEVSTEMVLKGYKKLVEYDLSEIYDDDGNVKPISQWSDNAKFAVTGFKKMHKKFVKKNNDGSKTASETIMNDVKLPDKKGVYDKLGEHLGMFEADNKQKRPDVNQQTNVQVNVVYDEIS